MSITLRVATQQRVSYVSCVLSIYSKCCKSGKRSSSILSSSEVQLTHVVSRYCRCFFREKKRGNSSASAKEMVPSKTAAVEKEEIDSLHTCHPTGAIICPACRRIYPSLICKRQQHSNAALFSSDIAQPCSLLSAPFPFLSHFSSANARSKASLEKATTASLAFAFGQKNRRE